MYLFSNHINFINTEENVFTTITSELINNMIEEFTEFHKEDISILENKLQIKLTVEFGFVYEVS